MNIKAGLVYFLVCCFCNPVVAQRAYFPKTTRYDFQVGAYLSSGERTPFWLRANQFGIVPTTTPAGTLRLGVSSDYGKPVLDSGNIRQKKFDWGYGVEVVGNAATNSKLLLPEAYVKARFGRIELFAGRRRNVYGLVDTTLTSGSYIWSGNTLPIPVIQIGTQGFVPLPLTKNFVSFLAFYNHGWFGNDRLVTGTYLHQKALYARLGKPTGKLKLYAGMNHQVQWAGYSERLDNNISADGYLPSNLRSYWYMITAYQGATRLDPTLSSFEENRVGNHLGTIDLGLELDLGSTNLLLYRQNIYDDGSLFYLTNIRDGLNGLRLKNTRTERSFFRINEFLTEFLYTKSQGGPEFVLADPSKRGRDNYFNHSQYIDGWTYKNRTIGTPFLTPGVDVRAGLPNGAIANNRVSMLHFGLSGMIGNVAWMGKLSYSDNIGTYNEPYYDSPKQLSSMLSLMAPVTLGALGDFQISAIFASDSGKLLYNSTGGYLGVRKIITSR
ncbi:capsule assembly Wzi family protein [Larkinella insperata]|uniref:Capsule assembly Wzi family protein n=1 Tax=Larkinella insperata TaxID=332158 RepID=A0ABW3QBH2_9BACT|nr:capsule assembly Wzi family protein [Larkinella insperata]